MLGNFRSDLRLEALFDALLTELSVDQRGVSVAAPAALAEGLVSLRLGVSDEEILVLFDLLFGLG